MTDSPLPQSGEAGASSESEDSQHQEVLDEFNRRFKLSKSHFEEWRTEARTLYDLNAGRQWDAADEAQLKDELRPMVTFNVAGKYMDAVVGMQINNRQQIRYYPREQGDIKPNELLTGAVEWGRDLCDQADDETDAFFDCVLVGLGWMEGYLDKDLERSGVPAGRRTDPLEMYPDPAARQRNLADSRFCIRLKHMDPEDYRELAGEGDEGKAGADEISAESDSTDRGIELITEPQDYDTDAPASELQVSRGQCVVADYQYWKRETRYAMSHPEYGEKDLTEEEFAAYAPMLEAAKAAGQPIGVEKIRKKVYYRAFISKGRVLQFGLSPYQDGFTYHPITGKRDRNKRSWYGIGRSIIDPQKWLNKFFSTILYVLMTNAKGGIMAEENTFKDARKAESEWAKPNAITWLKEGALQKGKLEQKPAAQYPQGLDRLMEFTLNSLPQVTGLNVELMGLADRVQAGVVEAQRKQSAMAIIAWAFDAMRRYYRSMGRQQARYVIDYMPEGTLVLINGAQNKQYVPLVKQQLRTKFDVIVDEAPTSTNMKERVWLVLESLIPQLLQAGLPIPPEVIDYSPLPTDLAQKWKQAIQGTPEANQQKAQQQAEAFRGMKAENDAKEAKAQKDRADAAKTMYEMQQPPDDGLAAKQAELQVKQFTVQLEAQVDARIAEFKANREAETRLLIERLSIESQERIAIMQATIDARLEAARIRADAQAAERETQNVQKQGEREERAGERASSDRKQSDAALAAAISGMGEAIKTLSKPKKVKRNKAGDIEEIG